MTISDIQSEFIQMWASVGVNWGINRTMAQVHALLLTTSDRLTADQIMTALNISRGNANMTLRELLNWGLIYRESKRGDRKDYFYAEKDMWEVAQKIARERSRRELEPMMKQLDTMLKKIKSLESNPETQSVAVVVSDIHSVGTKALGILDLLLKLDQVSFFKPVFGFVKKSQSDSTSR